MGKLVSLLKASMTEGMSLFTIGRRSKNGKKKSPVLPIFLAIIIGFSIFSYANIMLDSLEESGTGFVMLTLFVLITAALTLIEGVYKAGSLLFNCKDDSLMFSLPIKKSTVLFVRVFKLYVFEVAYNTLFMLPAMLAYALRVGVDWTFFLASVAALIFLPVIPIVLACIIGGAVTGVSSHFKMKNLAQIILTTAVLLGVLAVVGNLESLMTELAKHATSVNDLLTKLYYPAGAYVGMVTDFNWLNFVIFLGINVALFGLMVLVLGKIYFRINSRAKVVKAGARKLEYEVKKHSVVGAIVRKELNKFIDTPVFVINAGFGLVLFLVATIIISINFDSLAGFLKGYGVEAADGFGEIAKNFGPALLFGLLIMASLMSSITSSVISLEGRAFNILKTLPVKPITIIMSKVLSAVLIMMPFILAGDIVMFVRFDFSVLQILLILLASFILPMVAEMIGVAMNLKYPKMNATSDAEVVKQSTSSMVATFVGMGMTMLSAYLIIVTISSGMPMDLVLAIGVLIYAVLFVLLAIYLKKIGTKKFYQIEA